MLWLALSSRRGASVQNRVPTDAVRLTRENRPDVDAVQNAGERGTSHARDGRQDTAPTRVAVSGNAAWEARDDRNPDSAFVDRLRPRSLPAPP